MRLSLPTRPKFRRALYFDKKIITLNRQDVYISKQGYFFSTLKTKSSNRKEKTLQTNFILNHIIQKKSEEVFL